MGSSLSKLALSAGSTAGELCEGRIRLAEGGGVNLYWLIYLPVVGRWCKRCLL